VRVDQFSGQWLVEGCREWLCGMRSWAGAALLPLAASGQAVDDDEILNASI
jgi:hypothetical protein